MGNVFLEQHGVEFDGKMTFCCRWVSHEVSDFLGELEGKSRCGQVHKLYVLKECFILYYIYYRIFYLNLRIILYFLYHYSDNINTIWPHNWIIKTRSIYLRMWPEKNQNCYTQYYS